jgi:hypothetical protein
VSRSPVHDALAVARTSAVHLEMRDDYGAVDPAFADWRAGVNLVADERWRDWYDLIVATTARGAVVRRARIVSEPVTDYIRFEYDITAGLNIAAGEQVRWLPRRRASDLALPGNDFWLFDDEKVIFNHFAGDGRSGADHTEIRTDEAVVKLCASAFEAVWARAVPHEEYQLT